MNSSKNNPMRREGLPWRRIDNRVVIIQSDQGLIHELDPVASVIWDHADGNSTIDEIVTQVVEAFDVDPATAERDSSKFIEELRAKHLLVIY